MTVREISFLGGASVLRRPRWQFWKSCTATWPLARLTLRDDGIALRVLWEQCWFPRASVRVVRVRKGLLSPGIQIVPAGEGPEDWFVFWPLSVRRVLPFLLALRYPVAL
jgi:hypothetical protein